MKPIGRQLLELRLARDIRATARHFRLTPAAELQAVSSARLHTRRAAACYRAIARSLAK